MFDKSKSASCTAENVSDKDFNNIDGMLESSMPLLRRNLRRRHTLATKESGSKSSDKTANATIVEIAPMKNTPFLKRNLRIQHEGTSLTIRRKTGATKKESTARTNVRSQFRVHFITYESSDEMKKNMMMHSFLCPAYQCPFHCPYKGIDFGSLWHHCAFVHGDRYIFHPVQTASHQKQHLLVEENQSLSSPDVTLDKTEVIFCKRLPLIFTTTTHKKFRKRMQLPIRTYYHDVTFHPISLTEWLSGNRIDSFYESDQRWRRIVDTSALYELTDVLENEKCLMVMWNEHMRNNPIKAAAQLTPHLESFVRIHSKAIFEEQLEDELLKHLINMWVEGHIQRDDILHNMKIYNSLVDGRHHRRSGTRTHDITY